MPISRYHIRSEYSLSDPELHRRPENDDPETLLEAVSMAGLVGFLRQLGDLAQSVFSFSPSLSRNLALLQLKCLFSLFQWLRWVEMSVEFEIIRENKNKIWFSLMQYLNFCWVLFVIIWVVTGVRFWFSVVFFFFFVWMDELVWLSSELDENGFLIWWLVWIRWFKLIFFFFFNFTFIIFELNNLN